MDTPQADTPAQATVDRPQRLPRIRMSYDEYLALDRGTIHTEWVDGEAILPMPPLPDHQDIVGFLYTLLRLFASILSQGRVLPAPVEMKMTPEGSAREPDIVFLTTQHGERITRQRIVGPADLVIEVVSDETVVRDRVDKFYEYQEGGVSEYWVIDPRPRYPRADFWVLGVDGRYCPVPLDDDGIYHSTVLTGFWLDTNWLWRETLPDPLWALAQIVGAKAVIDALQRMIADAENN